MSKHSLLAAAAAPQQCEEEDKQQHEHPTSPSSSHDTTKSHPSSNSTNSSPSGDTNNMVMGSERMSPPSRSILPSEQKREGNTNVCASSTSSSLLEEPRLNSELFVGGVPSSSAVNVNSVAPVPVRRAGGCLNGISNSKGRGSTGRWTAAEHEAFLNGLRVHGREWKKVARLIPSRTAAQIRSHAQKYFAKLAKDARAQNAAAGAHLQVIPSMGSELAGAAAHGLAPLVPRQVAEGASLSISNGSAQEVPQGMSADSMELRKSVVERVSRIMQDPDSVQVEVEQTLQALRDRYSQLQRQLQQPRVAPSASNPPSQPSHIIQPEQDHHRQISTAVSSQNDTSSHTAASAPSPIPTPAPPRADTDTEVSSGVNAAVDSGPTTPSSVKAHDFFSKELIALSVLGRSLPSSAPIKPKSQCNSPSIAQQQHKPPSPHPQIHLSPNAPMEPQNSDKPATQVQEPCNNTDDDALLDGPRQKRQKSMVLAVTSTTTPVSKGKKSYP